MGPFLLQRKAPLTGEESEGQGILDNETSYQRGGLTLVFSL